jgi:probable HAF family extracellular repeat protein
MKNLGVLSGGDSSKALGINANGAIVGSSGSLLGTRAVLWSGGGIQDLGVLTGDVTSEAFAINFQGDIVGHSTGPVGSRPFLWTSKNGMRALDTLPGGKLVSRALGISDTGEIVGSSGSFLGARAVLWSPTGVPQDLNTLVTAPSGIVLMQAVGINALGHILVLGRDQTDTHGYHEGPNRSFLLR